MNEKHMDDMSLVATLDSEMEVGEELGVSQNFRSIISLVTCLQRHRIIDYKLDNQRPKTDYLELGCVPDPIVVWDPL